MDEQPACDAEITLTGGPIDLGDSPYAGQCEGCEYAFAMTAAVTTDNGTDLCDLDPFYTYIANAELGENMMAFAPAFSYATFLGEFALTDAVLSGAAYVSGDYAGYGFVIPSAYATVDGEPSGHTVSLSGNTLSWAMTYASSPAVPSCEEDAESDESTGATGTPSETYTMACSSDAVKRLAFTGTAGEAVKVSVNTVDATTAFDAKAFIMTPDDCVLVDADDSFDCAFPPPNEYSCPSIAFTTAVDGEYEVVVGSYPGEGVGDGCAGENAAFQVTVEAPSAKTITVKDEALPVKVRSKVDLSASGTITPG